MDSPEPSPQRRSRVLWLAIPAVLGLAVMGFFVWWWLDPGVPAITARDSFRAHRRAILTWYTSSMWDQAGITMAFSPDGKTLATGGEDNQVKLWDVATAKLIRSMPFAGKVESVLFTPDGSHLIAEGHGSIPVLWERPPGDDRDAPPAPPPSLLDPNPSRTETSSTAPPPRIPGDATAMIWKVVTGEPLGELFTPPKRKLAVNDGLIGLVRDAVSDDPRHALWYDATLADRRRLWGRLGDQELALASPDGHHYATGGGGGEIQLWDAETGRKVTTLRTGLFFTPSMEFSDDGSRFAATTWAGKLVVHDLTTNRSLEFATPSSNRTPLAMIGRDGRTLASIGHRVSTTPPGWFRRLPPFARAYLGPMVMRGRYGNPIDTLAIWDTKTGGTVAVLAGHEAEVCVLVASPDRRTLASSDWSGSVRLWDLP